MFPFISATWNPLGGECLHQCSYCWAKTLIKKYNFKKYVCAPAIVEQELKRVFKHNDFVFTCDMTDLFGEWVPKVFIQRILDRMLTSQATYLLLTKNPARYLEFDLPKNSVAGATIECDMNFKVNGNAPTPCSRLEAMRKLKHPRKMVSIEPIMNYSTEFLPMLLDVKPEFIAVGYDNYNNNLPEPYLAKTMGLIQALEQEGVKVYRKTLREKHD